MRRFLLILVLLVVVGATGYIIYSGNQRPDPVAVPAGGSVKIGLIAPDVTLKTLDGATVSLSQYRGKVVVLNFWATWCPPCLAEMPSMEKLYRMFPDGDLVMLAVNTEEDGAEILPGFLKNHPHSFNILLDPNAAAQQTYGVFRFPESFIIGRDGRVVDKVIGAIDWVDPKVVSFFQTLMKGI